MKFENIREIVKSLNEANVRYLVVGGIAVAAHGYRRYTEDLDLVIALEPANVLRAMNVFEQQGYRPRAPVHAGDFANPAKRESWIREKYMVVFQMAGDPKRQVPVDIFVTEPFDFEAEWRRCEKIPIGTSGVFVPVVSYDQLIALKRAAGRGSDLIDIEKLEKLREYNKE